MYPDLSYLFHDLFGSSYDNWTSIFKTFGLLLAIAFLASAYVLKLELQRKEKEGVIKAIPIKEKQKENGIIVPLIINFFIGFLIGFKLFYIFFNFAVFKADPASTLFSSKGNLLGGIIVSLIYLGYTYWDLKKNSKSIETKKSVIHPYERTGDITIIAAISGLIGARLFSVLENLDSFFQDPLGQLLSGSGLTIYGGLLLAFIVVYWYVKKHGIPPIHMMDMAALAVIIGYGVGRLGCQFSGDGDWGIVNEMAKPSWFFLPDWLWSYNYPHNVAQQGVAIAGCEANYCRELIPRVFPTPLYESLASLLIFFILWSIRKRVKIAGMLFFIYLIFQGIERFLIETIRVNPRYNYFGFDWSQAQYISLGFLIVGIIGIIYLYNKNKKQEKIA
jgi:prolipoprotein diacylglyceryl transferase